MIIVRGRAVLKTTALVLVACAVATGVCSASPASARHPSKRAQGKTTRKPNTSVTFPTPVKTVGTRDIFDYVQIGAVLAALISAVLIWIQLRSSAKAARQQRAADASRTWSDRRFLAYLSPVWAFLEVRSLEDCIRKVRSWVSAPDSEHLSLPGDGDAPVACKNDVNYVIGVIEDVAVRYNRKEIDLDWVELMLAPSLVDTLSTWLWFVAFSRVNEDWETWGAEWQRMVWKLRGSRNASFRSVHVSQNIRAKRLRRRLVKQGTYEEIVRTASQPVRILCLPLGPKQASDDDWARAIRLSAAVAEAERRYGLAGIPNVPAPEGPPPSGWKAVVIPKSIDDERDNADNEKELSRRLNAYLHGMTDVEKTIGDFGRPP